MTTYKNSLMYGGGIMDNVAKLFTSEKYPGERHVPGFSYLGPYTRTDIRLDANYNPQKGEEPINKLDSVALQHDIAYAKVKK